MAKSPAHIDESIRNRIQEALDASAGSSSSEQADLVMKALLPIVGSTAQRRRNESSMRVAFKEGFHTGQRAGRFSQWHSIIWAQSMLCRRFRTEASRSDPREIELRSRYNDL